MAASVIQDALALLRDQSVDAAIDCLEEAVVDTPAYPAAYVLLARAYESCTDWGAARSAWDQAFVLMPHSPTVRNGRTRVRTHLREERRARQGDEPAPGSPSGSAERTRDAAAGGAEREAEDASGPALPSLSMDEGPADLDALRAQTDEAARAQAASAASKEEAADALESLDDDLDALIEELQSARIHPDPNIEELDPEELDDDIDDMVSETLARIYAAQGAYHEAARVYVQLAMQEPEASEERLRSASEMRQKARAQRDSDAEA